MESSRRFQRRGRFRFSFHSAKIRGTRLKRERERNSVGGEGLKGVLERRGSDVIICREEEISYKLVDRAALSLI